MTAPYWPDGRARVALDRFDMEEDRSIKSLAELKREIYQYGKRRCDEEASTDNLKYYLGFGFEVNEALDIDSLALTGMLSLPWATFQSTLSSVPNAPSSLVDALRLALEDPAIHSWSREKGIWLQWKRLEAIYRTEVDDFRNSDAFKRKGWRRKSITRAQHYLIGEISRIQDIPAPALTNRGEAFDYIARSGGNPRFIHEPTQPSRFWKD